MRCFTAEFGMGSGGSNALWSSSNQVLQRGVCRAFALRHGAAYSDSDRGVAGVFCGSGSFSSSLLTQIVWVLYGQASRAISIG
jgi:hypothetical protein